MKFLYHNAAPDLVVDDGRL